MFLVRHAQGLLAVDAGFPGWAYAILTAARSLPEPNQITHVILTHAHSDHIGGAAALAEETGAEVLCCEAERPFIEGASLAKAAKGFGSKLCLALNHAVHQRHVDPIRVSGTVGEGDLVEGLSVVSVPGHTPGQIALLHPGDGVVLCADSVFNVQGGVGFDPTPGITTDTAAARETVRRLVDLDVPDIIPSHGPALLEDGPQRLRQFLARD